MLTVKDQRQAVNAGLGYSQSAYDDLGRLIAEASAVTTADATETDYAYDNLDRQTTVTTGVSDPSAQATSQILPSGSRQLKPPPQNASSGPPRD